MLSERLQLWNLPFKCFEFRITSGSLWVILIKRAIKTRAKPTLYQVGLAGRGQTNGISVSEDRIQIILLMLRRGALSRNSFSVASGIDNTNINSIAYSFVYSTPPAKKTEPSNLVLRAQDHKKNPKFKGWQWDLKNPKFKIRSSKERRTKSEITEIVVEKYMFKIPKIQNFRNTRNQ